MCIFHIALTTSWPQQQLLALQ